MPVACPLETLVMLLDTEVTGLVERLRRRTPLWWSNPSACPGWSRADVVAHVVGGLAETDHVVRGASPRRPTRPGRDEVLLDQLAVCGRDVVTSARSPAVRPVEPLVARSLAEVVVHGWDVDRTGPGVAPAEAVLGWLAPARTTAAGLEPGAAAWSRLLLAVTGRDPTSRPAAPWSWES